MTEMRPHLGHRSYTGGVSTADIAVDRRGEMFSGEAVTWLDVVFSYFCAESGHSVEGTRLLSNLLWQKSNEFNGRQCRGGT